MVRRGGKATRRECGYGEGVRCARDASLVGDGGAAPQALRRRSRSLQEILADGQRPRLRLFEESDRRGDDHAALSRWPRRPRSRSRRAAMFAGEPINRTENRPVLHVALRAAPDEIYRADGKNVVPEVTGVLNRMADFADGVRSGAIAAPAASSPTSSISASAAPISARPWRRGRSAPSTTGRACISSPMSTAPHIRDTLAGLDPARTLFLVASKTFTTIETMTNARTAREWIVEALGEEAGRRRISRRCRRRSTRSRPSASARTAPSASGTGSAAATRSGRRSACR